MTIIKKIAPITFPFIGGVVLCFASISAVAQEQNQERPRPPFDPNREPGESGRGRFPGRGGPPPLGPGDQSFRFISSEMRFGGKTVQGAPFSATAETEFVQMLQNGSKITRRSKTQLYRDTAGRTRREQTLQPFGALGTSDEAPKLIFIHDPVAKVSYVLDVNKKSAHKMPMREDGKPPFRPGTPPESAQAKTETLGTKVIEGVEATGTRTTITIPAGQIGNDQPLEIISEQWYSAALQETVLRTHTDPRMGNHSYRLTSINRAEPASTLFELPADYTLNQDRGPREMGRPGMKKDGLGDKNQHRKPRQEERDE